MKKWKYGLLLLAAALMLSGCSKEEETQTETEPERPDYYVGVEEGNAPYYVLDAEGNASGFYVELMNTLAEQTGFTYEFRAMSAAEYAAYAAVSEEGDSDAGEADCDFFLGTLVPEVGDASTYVQSEPVYETGLCLLVNRGQGIRETKDLRSVSVAARAETEEERFSRYLSAKYHADTVVFQDAAGVMSDVGQGYSQAVVLDAGSAASAMGQNANLKLLTTSEKYFSVHRFTASAGQGIPEEIAAGLAQISADGTLGALLQQAGLQ